MINRYNDGRYLLTKILSNKGGNYIQAQESKIHQDYLFSVTCIFWRKTELKVRFDYGKIII